MSNQPTQSQTLQELAQLPASDPRRQGLEAQIQNMETEERDHWMNVLKETDQLYGEVGRVTIPPGLEEKLLALPDQPVRALPWTERLGLLNWKRAWQPLAAAAAVVIAVGGYLLFAPARPPEVLGDEIAGAISADAIHDHEAHPALEIASSDPAQVQSKLASRVDFPVVVLQPKENLTLDGGGVVDFGGTPAVYTRWEQPGGPTYSLYQLDGRKIGVPAAFLRTVDQPKQLWHDSFKYRVVIWPGKGMPCTWALVMENDSATDAFSHAY